MSGAPTAGTLVRDKKRDRVGVVMGKEGGMLYLRPINGGREWEAAPEDVEPADASAALRAKVGDVNKRTWGRIR